MYAYLIRLSNAKSIPSKKKKLKSEQKRTTKSIIERNIRKLRKMGILFKTDDKDIFIFISKERVPVQEFIKNYFLLVPLEIKKDITFQNFVKLVEEYGHKVKEGLA